MNDFPINTNGVIRLSELIKHKENLALYERMSSRIVKCASVLDREEFLGWEMNVPRKGLVEMYLFGTTGISEGDMKWIAEYTAETKSVKADTYHKKSETLSYLYELSLPIYNRTGSTSIGFGAVDIDDKLTAEMFRWPMHYSSQFEELIKALQTTGAVFRAVVGSASKEEQRYCKKNLLKSWDSQKVEPRDYIGRPVRTRFLLRLPDKPTLRLTTILEEAIPGVCLQYIGRMEEETCISTWELPLEQAVILPEIAAKVLLMEPETSEAMIGIEVCDEKPKPIPVGHKNTKTPGAVTIGKAMSTTGIRRKITIGETDLKRHYQIVGQTGTGKSTLLVTIIMSAIEQGYGLTFFDPHGSTIDVILRTIPEKYADKIRVVRIGDAEHPVPIGIWDSGDIQKEERTISDLSELFSDIFDPRKEGFVGPRWERWWATFAKAAIALFGQRASFESIAQISQSQENMKKVYKAIVKDYPEIAETIKEEYIKDNSTDFVNTLNWYLCKFQRLTSVEQLRRTLGAGINALNFNDSIDTDTVTLIDLASPTIGTHAARLVGTLLLMKLWNAAMLRKERDKTHMVVVDEASLFQTNPMPRMLAESRKFGISIVLCHQHGGQFTQEIKDALEANSANFSAFRLSPRDAYEAAIRLDDSRMQVGLTRLNAFQAITTLSVDGQQTSPFSLEIDKPKKEKRGEEIAALIEHKSKEELVEKYSSYKALTPKEILDALNRIEDSSKKNSIETILSNKGGYKQPGWLTEWQKQKENQSKTG